MVSSKKRIINKKTKALATKNQSIKEPINLSTETLMSNQQKKQRKKKNKRQYTLSLHEIRKKAKRGKIYTYTKQSLVERLRISSINYDTTTTKAIKRKSLGEEERTRIKEWRSAMNKGELFYPPQAKNPKNLHLHTFLCNIQDTLFKDENDLVPKSEIAYTAENLTPLFKYLFPAGEKIGYTFEKSAVLGSNGLKTLRTDIIIVANNTNIGCCEVKTAGAAISLVNEDRARIAENLKRQLHLRILKSKSKKEFVTFGIMFYGPQIELYQLNFCPNKAQTYQLKLVKEIRFERDNIKEMLQYMLSFVNIVNSSLPTKEDEMKPLIHHKYNRLFKPTLAFLKQ